MRKAVGIDLGTTYSVAAVMENGRAKIIENREGKYLTPSVFAVSGRGQILVGEAARTQAAVNSEGTVFSVKRLMGIDKCVSVNGHSYSPQEISAFILRKMKTDIEARLGFRIKETVLTVPAYFNDTQRQATKEAGLLAGFDVLRIINEPTAASLAYGLNQANVQTILVWDLGGGTFDVSILELGNGVFQVKAVSGNTSLGGDDWDCRLVDFAAEKLLQEHGFDVRSDRVAFQRLKEAVEKSKRELSYKYETQILLTRITTESGMKKDLKIPIDRTTFEQITADLTDMLLASTRQALQDSGLSAGRIERVVLVGGATRMPAVKKMVECFFQKKAYDNINPDEVVAIGAAVQAGVLTGEVKDVVLVDVTPLSLGIETQCGLFTPIIPRNSTVPTSAGQIFTNAQDDQTVMDIHILQGEREMAEDNISLGNFQLTGIPPLPRGSARVEVSFEIDVNGMVHVSALDLNTERRMDVGINTCRLLPDEQVRRIIQEAEINADEDLKRRKEMKIHIMAESMLAAAEGVMAEEAEKRPHLHLQDIDCAMMDLRDAVAEGLSEVIEKKTNRLRHLLNELKKP